MGRIEMRRIGLAGVLPCSRGGAVPLARQRCGTHRRWSSSSVPGIISKEELQLKLATNPDGFHLLDVRQAYELESLPAIHPRARLIPLQELPGALEMSEDEWEDAYDFPKPQPSEEIVCYCKSGMRSEMACSFLRQEGFARVANYQGSALDWWSS